MFGSSVSNEISCASSTCVYVYAMKHLPVHRLCIGPLRKPRDIDLFVAKPRKGVDTDLSDNHRLTTSKYRQSSPKNAGKEVQTLKGADRVK